jgi:uncharacterized protein YecT (DUF1311 family)
LPLLRLLFEVKPVPDLRKKSSALRGIFLCLIFEKISRMKKLICLLLTTISLVAAAQTQTEMNEEAYKRYTAADKELNDTYRKILKEYKTDTAFVQSLKASQKIWIKFRDAEVKVKYPERPPGYYGSIQPLCQYSYLTDLTTARITTLKNWLDGIDEGDMCGGSIRTK